MGDSHFYEPYILAQIWAPGDIQSDPTLIWICWVSRLAVIFQNPARNNFWEAGIVMQSYMLDTVQ